MNNVEQPGTSSAYSLISQTKPLVVRTPVYFKSGNRRIFGCYHAPSDIPLKNCTAVICNPLGYEYTHGYRSLRHLADRLAAAGIPAFRFEYSATGNSSDDDLPPALMTHWLDDIRAAITAAKNLSGNSDICLIGIRMGATLAAQIAHVSTLPYLVLWSPCVSGRQYVREMIALASAAADRSTNSAIIESAGFVLHNETAGELKKLDLKNVSLAPNNKVLMVQRDDLSADSALKSHWQNLGIDVTEIAQPGFAEMMAEPQFTVVPQTAIDSIVKWLCGYCEIAEPNIPDDRSTFSDATLQQDGTPIIERICRFGPDNQLFGILSVTTADNIDRQKPAIVFLNSGSVHQVGPNRLYVTLARKLATLGHPCLRLDLQGLGDSPILGQGSENHPYPITATQDTAAALTYLSSNYGYSTFILMGLCSGAHNSFHAAIDLPEFNTVETILINPLTFKYVEGMTLETTQHFLDVAYYKKSARSINSWLKLLRGKVNVANLLKIAASQTKVMIESFDKYVRESLFNEATSQLSTDLRKLLARKIRLSLFVAANDPGYSILTLGAQYMTKKGIKAGLIKAQFIPGADHTFSRLAPREEVIARIYSHIQSNYSTPQQAEPHHSS